MLFGQQGFHVSNIPANKISYYSIRSANANISHYKFDSGPLPRISICVDQLVKKLLQLHRERGSESR